jgi:hypothetical protein
MKLYDQSRLYGGQRDDNRDSRSRLKNRITNDPDAIIVAEDEGIIVGTVSLIEDGRVAWLFRFAVQKISNEAAVLDALYTHAAYILKSKGHNQVLVYSPTGNSHLDRRYDQLGFQKGGDFTCYWKNLD